MALIADLVEALKDSLKLFAFGSKDVSLSLDADLDKMLEAIEQAAGTLLGNPELDFSAEVREAAEFLRDPKGTLKRNTSDMATQLIDGWTNMLTIALDELNVDAPIGPERGIEDITGSIQAELQRGGRAAQERVSVIVAVINLVVVTGNAASIAAEMLTAGMVKSIAEAIQSWVWANGLGGMTSMAFSPQMNASVGPWLDRLYNERAQAKLPGPADLVRFQLREVYLEGRREELVGNEPRPVYDTFMSQLGFSKFHADSYWGAHWTLPSISQLNEMLFRGVIDQDEWTRFVRFNDFEPSQIPNLQQIIFNPYTRVDVRRMHRMGILDDVELLQAYADLGNFAPTQPDESGRLRAQFVPVPDFTVHKAQALVIFTKVFNALPELRQRFRRGWISRGELLVALTQTGVPADKARILWQTIVDAEAKSRTAPERELTRGLIARAFKLSLISFGQGLFLLERIGWSLAESELILRVQSAAPDPLQSVDTALGARLTEGAVAAVPEGDFEGDFI